ncbi:MAG: site-specific integrase [Chthoniobacterales bacterium]
MASLTRKPTSKYWFACFRDKNGKQHRKSTEEIRKSVAQKIADKYELAATRKTSRRQLWDALNELQAIVSGDETPSATVQDFCELWLDNRKAERKASATLSIYENLVERFLAFLGPVRASGSLIDVRKRDIERYRNFVIERKLAPGTVNRDLRILRSLFRTARLDGYIFEDPAEGVRSIKDDAHGMRRPLTEEQIRAVLAVANPEWQSLIKLGLYTGQRLGDLARLLWQDVDLVQGRLSLITRKTGQKIKLPITGPLREHLLSLPSSDNSKEPLHPRAYELVKSQQGRVGSLSHQFHELLVEAGLQLPRTHESTGKGRSGPRTPSELSFHSLRHSAVSMLKNSGVPHSIAQALVGHESAEISQNYTHVGEAALAEALQKFPTL